MQIDKPTERNIFLNADRQTDREEHILNADRQTDREEHSFKCRYTDRPRGTYF